MVCLPVHANPSVTVHWYVVNRCDIDVHHMIACLSNLSKHGAGKWTMPPMHWLCTRGRLMERALFTDLWMILKAERARMLSEGVQWRDFVQNMEQTKRLIPFAPFNWLRRIFAISKAWNVPLDQKGSFIYACVSPSSSKVYIGQTGCRTGRRALAKRFSEHLNGAALFARGKSYKRFRHESPERFYEALSHLGREDFIIVPLQFVKPREGDTKEILWIRKWGSQVYNIQHTRWRTGKRWHSLCDEPLPKHALTTSEVTALIHQQLNRPRRGQSPNDLLQLWLAAGGVSKPLKQRLGHRLREVAKARVHMHLPARIPIPYPVHNSVDLSCLKSTVRDIINHLPIPKLVRAYLQTVVCFVARRQQPVGRALFTQGTALTKEQLHKRASMQCACASLPDSLPRVQGCVCVRSGPQLKRVVPALAPTLCQNMKNAALGNRKYFQDACNQACARLHKSFPGIASDWKYWTRNALHRAMDHMLDTAESETPTYMHQHHLEQVREKLSKQWEWIPVDKNPGKGFLVCKTLYAKLLEKIFYDPVQFEPVASLNSKTDAMNLAKDLLFRNAMRCDVEHFFKSSGKTAAPSAFIYIKNKSDEFHGELKCRVLFSYARHPLRAIGKQVGRALNVCISVGKSNMNTFEMLKTSDLKAWVHETNHSLRHKHIRDRDNLKLWELDVREMFPRLPRGNVHNVFERPPSADTPWCAEWGVWEAFQLQGLRAWEAQGRRFTAGAPWIALNKYSRKWDRLGKGYDNFSNLSWTDVRNYMMFDIFFNDIFVLGGQVLRQKRGVAIGGFCSAQCASIYCMQREDFWHRHLQDKTVPWCQDTNTLGRRRVALSLHCRPYRFRDNMVGVRSGKSSIQSVCQYFQRVLGVELQVEGEGKTWTNLEGCMSVHNSQIDLRLKTKMTWDVPEHRRLLRFPDCCSPNARAVLQSLAPALCQKALFYASTVQGVTSNLYNIVQELSYKGYPTSWWVPQLYRVLHMAPGRLQDLGVDDAVIEGMPAIRASLSGLLKGPCAHSMGRDTQVFGYS